MKKNKYILEENPFSIPKCNNCFYYHKNRNGATCKAFPNGIPVEILTNEHDHTKPFKGDNGILFEPTKESKE
jgi:hypothetical protein